MLCGVGLRVDDVDEHACSLDDAVKSVIVISDDCEARLYLAGARRFSISFDMGEFRHQSL